MQLIVPMYHRASPGRHGNPASMLDAHFAHIARSYHCVLPGEPLDPDRLNVCLSFDDGYYDFRAVVFPLLVRHRLRALLAMPVAFLREDTAIPGPMRLRACEARGSDAENSGGHCTWPELATMAQSGTVAVAAHGYTHRRLDLPGIDLHSEIVVPQTLLAARIGCAVDSFVLPYGRFTTEALDLAKRHYRYVMRIGSADNDGWDARMLYRVSGDEMMSPEALFSRRRLAAYRLRRRWNTVRTR